MDTRPNCEHCGDRVRPHLASEFPMIPPEDLPEGPFIPRHEGKVCCPECFRELRANIIGGPYKRAYPGGKRALKGRSMIYRPSGRFLIDPLMNNKPEPKPESPGHSD